MKEFDSLDQWISAAMKAGLSIRTLSKTDPEDVLDHYFAGDDSAYDHFLITGGDLCNNSGYCCVDGFGTNSYATGTLNVK